MVALPLPNDSKSAAFGQAEKPNRVKRTLNTIGRFARVSPAGILGAAIICLLIVVALFSSQIAPYNPVRQSSPRLLPPSPEHLMGTDHLGRDMFSRIVFGARVSLYVGLISVTLALTIGTTMGVIAGYFGKRVDALLMRVTEIMLAFPGLVLALLVAGLLGPNVTNTMIAVGIINVPTYARVARASVMTILAQDYILASHAVGGSDLHIIRKHILPNIMVPLIVLITISLSTAILAESSLSFLGLGIQPPDPSWGSMLSNARDFMELDFWIAIFPGAAIMLAVLAFNFFGDGLRDVLDPRMRGVGF